MHGNFMNLVQFYSKFYQVYKQNIYEICIIYIMYIYNTQSNLKKILAVCSYFNINTKKA